MLALTNGQLSPVDLLPSGVTLVVAIVVLFAIRFLLGKAQSSPTKNFRVQTIMLFLSLVALLFVALMLPNEDGIRDSVVALLGIVLSATIALSSTTILGNALAGVQLRVVGAFKTDDFLQAGKHFGRVTERGLFHTEIQTEDSDLTTLPNLYLVNNPYKVVRASKTIISTTVSLGYDVPRSRIQDCLVVAAKNADLKDPFVHVEDLGDYSVTYRIAGVLNEVKEILSRRSTLRKRVMDELHQAGIEIVSPAYMAQRRVDPDNAVVPEATVTAPEADMPAPEAVIFDKALDMALVEKNQARLEALAEEILEAEKAVKAAGEDGKAAVEKALATLREERDALAAETAVVEERVREAADAGE